jgi:hypothetical protein
VQAALQVRNDIETTLLPAASTTNLTVTYVVGAESVFQNGIRLIRNVDYTATNGTTIVLTNPTIAGDIFQIGVVGGYKGDTGPQGIAATITVGTVTSGTTALVNNTGTTSAAVLNFTIPRGADSIVPGPQGIQGVKGDTGATGPQGPQGLTGAVGATGAQGLTGAQGAQGPQGIQGVKGDTGATGAQGPAGTGTGVDQETVEDIVSNLLGNSNNTGISYTYNDAANTLVTQVTSSPKLTTARNINGVAFDGTANITINAVDSTARIATSSIAVPNGLATLDGNALVPSTQIPQLALSKLSDFTVTTPTAGQILAYNGTKFVNQSTVSIAATAPDYAALNPGVLYINTTTGYVYILVLESGNKAWIQLG